MNRRKKIYLLNWLLIGIGCLFPAIGWYYNLLSFYEPQTWLWKWLLYMAFTLYLAKDYNQ